MRSQSEAFVQRVMTPIGKRSRWRTPLLFGAGGIGVGAALSQIGGLFGLIKSAAPEISISVQPLPTTPIALESQSLWALGVLALIVSCAAIVATERA